jgi:WD40 repeat protein
MALERTIQLQPSVCRRQSSKSTCLFLLVSAWHCSGVAAQSNTFFRVLGSLPSDMNGGGQQHTLGVTSVAFSPTESSKVVTGSFDKSGKLWNADTQDFIGTFFEEIHTDGISAVAWSPDGSKIATGSYDYTVKIWDATKQALLLRTLAGDGGHSAYVTSVTWSPDSTKIASCSVDGAIIIWTVSTGAVFRTVLAQTSAILTVAWSPNAEFQWIASGSEDNTITIWNADFSQGMVKKLKTITGHAGNVNILAWSPDSARLASGSVRVFLAEMYTRGCHWFPRLLV